MSLFWRYQLAFLGGFLAMTAHVYLVFGRGGWLLPQRIGSAISAGLMFGHIVALMIFFARDLPDKLHDKWPTWARILLSIVGGVLGGTLAWWSHITLILYNASPDWVTLIIGGIGLSAGFILVPLVRPQNHLFRAVFLIVVTTTTIYLPIYFTYQNYLTTFNTSQPVQALLYFQVDNPAHVWLIGLPFAMTIAITGQIPPIISWMGCTAYSKPMCWKCLLLRLFAFCKTHTPM